MEEKHKKAVESNITRLGYGPEHLAFLPYEKDNHSRLRYKFTESASI